MERTFKTFQDRLIKELRLKNIKTIDEANKFLDYYLPVFNQRFSVEPIEKEDFHRPLSKDINLDKILCKKTECALRNDFTIAYDKKFYQLLNRINAKKVMVEERTSGRMLVTYKDKPLKYRPIATKPAQQQNKPPKYIFTIVKQRYIPPKSHPYKRFKRSPYSRSENYIKKEEVPLLIKT